MSHTEANHMRSNLGLESKGGLVYENEYYGLHETEIGCSSPSIDLICHEILSKTIITLEAKCTSSLSRFLTMGSKCSFT